MLMPALPDQTQRLQSGPDRRPRPSIALRQPYAEGPVRESEPEPLDGFLAVDAAALEVVERVRSLGQPLLIELDDAGQEGDVLGSIRERVLEAGNRRLLQRS